MFRQKVRRGPAAAGTVSLKKERHRYVRVLNREGESIRLLTKTALKCVLNICFPGSGIIYQKKSGGTRPADGSTAPVGMSPLAKACISPLLPSLCLLFQLNSLFPIHHVGHLQHHVEYGAHLLAEDMSDQYIVHYYFQPSKLSFHYEKEEISNLFRSFWLMISFYGFAKEALDISTQKLMVAKGQAASHNATAESTETKKDEGTIVKGESTLLTEREAKQIRLLATSAPPLLRMCSSEMHQALADIVVLLRYADIRGDPTSRKGIFHHAISSHLSRLFKGAAEHASTELLELHSSSRCKKWLKKLNTSELYLVQALAELELLRASSGSIANLTVYNHFEIREFVASPQVKNVLLEVVGAVCAQYMTSLLTLPPGLAPRLVAKDIHQLLLMFSFSIDSVRQAARLMLEMVITSFPAYSVYAGELPLLWTVIDLVDGGTDADLERLCLRLHYQETPAISPDRDSIERQMHLQEMVQLAESWVVHGRQAAPVELFSLATRFVLYQETVKGGTSSPLMGTRLASLAAQPYDEERQSEQSGSGVLSLSEPSKASYAGALVKFSGAQGQVLSALRLESFASVEERILSQLLTAVRFGRSKATISTVNHFRIRLRRLWQAVEGSDSVQSGKELVKQMDSEVAQDDVPRGQLFEFESALGSAVALLTTNLTSPSISVKLLRYVVQAPLILFHKDYIQRAVQSWRWFLSPDRERYSLWMLQQIVEGVEFTIAHKLGLFDGLQPSQADQVQSGDFSGARRIENTYPRDYDVHSPHSLVIAFLAEEYVNPGCASSQDSVHLRYLYELASRMVAVPEQWSLKDSSFAETMRASSFLLHVCRAIQLNNGRRSRARLPLSVPYTSLGVLRQRLYTCLLRWFRQDPPRWYFARQPTLALQQVNMLTELIHVLRDEHNSVRRSTLGFADLYFPVANRTQESIAAQNKVQSQMSGILALLRTLVEHELLRIRVWQNPRRTLEIPQMSPVGSWASHVQSATENDPAVAIALVSRFPAVKAVRELVSEAVVKTPSIFADIPGAVDLYLTEEVLARGAPHLHLFTNCSIVQALRLLDKRYVHFNGIPKYAIRSLLSQKSEYLIFYLPQLLQVLATDESGDIEDFLYRTSHKSTMFCHQLLWALQTEGEGTNELAKRCSHLEERIKSRMTPDELLFYQSEFAFTDLVTSLSGELMKFDKPLRKPNLRQRLRDDEFHDGPAQAHVYLPTDIGFRITDVIPHTAGAMQSAAKCPILVQFKCVPREPEDRRTPPEMTEEEQQIVPVVKGCIFKMGDDCRQDQLSLQLMELFRRVLDSVGVPSYLYPYRVVTTGRESGIIECVPNAQSRNEIGKLVETNLAEFFVQTFGHPESVGFKRARANFIQSTAAYSIVSFILNIKDRHNGNIMIDNKGNLVHIDFGFLFDTSPGGDMNFESSPFKLTTEMVQLIGKDVGSDSKLLHSSKALSKALVDEDNYVYFKVLVNRIYLAVRQYGREICLLVELMLRSGLPCFKPKKTIKDLAERLALDKDEVTAADYMRKRIHEARQNYRTVLYDHYQRIAEGIAM
ncbi:phosphatidylinositol 4-kinase [Angomonas deanei]|uniref:1-phosphatidylinositol 4-kinase n=1 Tax=Angomonas deanei TaxID=59799 RepID=A0A7G2CFG9_9TRYP|nr:phosphatidylinositol 4-kinase [Angomonas deanei]CAD2218526.1 Phosphoinositide 3-kinase family, accessory domain (PIK domain)/Phosphatidylinositol 3- and 4-kinase, putative [Angomonas deanei]|eukprot:EPY27343.1 phosphatidylinositol 4-kinase [Angomonas deanei]